MSSIPSQKTCSNCGETKSLSEFHKHVRMSDGHASQCKWCRKSKAAQEKSRLAKQGLRKCTKCKEVKPFSEFHKEEKGSFGIRPDCKVCNRKRRRNYYEENPERARKQRKRNYWKDPEARRRSWRKWRARNLKEQRKRERQYWRDNLDKARANNHRRRARLEEAEGSYTAEEFEELCERYDNRCLCCGRDDVELTADHVIPLSWEGSTNDISNIQPLCLSCNSSKGNWHATDYREENS